MSFSRPDEVHRAVIYSASVRIMCELHMLLRNSK
jgi:hypothetical protein